MDAGIYESYVFTDSIVKCSTLRGFDRKLERTQHQSLIFNYADDAAVCVDSEEDLQTKP